MANISGTTSGTFAAYSLQQAMTAYRVSNVNALNPIASLSGGGKVSGTSMSGLQGVDSVSISDEAYDLLLTPGNYRPNIIIMQPSDKSQEYSLDVTA